MNSFTEFLRHNAIETSETLPLVHTTRSFRLRKIIETSSIEAQDCDVFIGEKLNYFFVGRPSYKYDVEDGTDHWMLPTAFVFDFDAVRAKRLFPFDSGGFAKKRMPQFVNEMEVSFFDAAGVSEAAQRIIGAFFGNAKNYMDFRGLSDREFFEIFELSPLDAEIHALHKLSLDPKKPSFDDRQFSIEVQSETPIFLNNQLKAVVLPVVYLDDPSLVNYFQNIDVQILSYDIHPIEPKFHFYAIYDRIKTFYQSEGLI
ncbi:hypothetical protein [Frigidibacter sp. SD6-1]|uniref:hypothetical protein n=1 Tax=Frigidibacter sp. SD6-1 TaxID=3032581 RepID=UPI0024DFF2A6|nr:hypothetical protein [Frigidibacter sp. SD6-1]